MRLFDDGFEAVRQRIFENQKRLGVIPPDAQLTPWPSDLLRAWDQHTPEEKKLLIRQADVYGAFLAYADHEIGRVIRAVEAMNKLDNTIIIYISGDNGASAEGSAMGTWNEILPFNGINPTVAENMPFYDAWGNDQTYPHYSINWAWTFGTPYKWTKQISVLLRRHEERHGDLLAGTDQGQGRHPLAVPPCGRHRSDAA
jgi:arylsulfatase